MINKALYTSNSDDWETPQYLFDQLNNEFHFTLDACASDGNKKVDNYYDNVSDGLNHSWGGRACSAIPRTHRLKSGSENLFMKDRSPTL